MERVSPSQFKSVPELVKSVPELVKSVTEPVEPVTELLTPAPELLKPVSEPPDCPAQTPAPAQARTPGMHWPFEPCEDSVQVLSAALVREHDERRRAECLARIQSNAVQLALDLLVREANISGFFRVFIKQLVDECESHACGVWLLDDDQQRCDLWMAQIQDRLFTRESPDWDTLALPREGMQKHLHAYRPGWTKTIEYRGDDPRLPETVRAFNAQRGMTSLVVSPLVLPTRNLGWVVLSTAEVEVGECVWRQALVEAMARQATLALHQSRLAEHSRQEDRRQAVLEERNRIARDIHDTLAQGFAAILMQLQAAQRSTGPLPPTVARRIDTAVDLARSHMIEARRSVGALRPQIGECDDVGVALERMTDLARRSTDVPIALNVDSLPPFGGGVEREILAIAQEALTNAVRHARAHTITLHAESVRSVGFRLSVADDGRGIAKERRGTGFGMTSMQERADRIGASLTIVTAPRSGTEVVLAWEPPSFSIPIPEESAPCESVDNTTMLHAAAAAPASVDVTSLSDPLPMSTHAAN